MFAKYLMYSFFILCIIALFPSAKSNCNESVCGSVVSKCLITKDCECKLSDCFCCMDCYKCLGSYYLECCSCFDMCPPHNETTRAHAPKSVIGNFNGAPELFNTYAAMEDDEWTTMRIPMSHGISPQFTGKVHNFGDDINNEKQQRHQNTVNCTVVFLNKCTTVKKCLEFCRDMGSKSFRWFHDSCCECVGENCFNYGINESHCSACPDVDEDDEFDQMNDDNMDNFDFAGEYENMSWDFDEEN